MKSTADSARDAPSGVFDFWSAEYRLSLSKAPKAAKSARWKARRGFGRESSTYAADSDIVIEALAVGLGYFARSRERWRRDDKGSNG
jgi:hypothetical protein